MEENQNPKQQLKVTGAGEYLIKGIAKWMNIIGIVAAIMTAFMAIIAIWLLTRGFSATTGAGIVYLIIAGLYTYPVLKTLGVSKYFKLAAETTDDNALEKGFEDFKSLVTFIGVLTIIGVIFVVIGIIVSISTYNQVSSEIHSLF